MPDVRSRLDSVAERITPVPGGLERTLARARRRERNRRIEAGVLGLAVFAGTAVGLWAALSGGGTPGPVQTPPVATITGFPSPAPTTPGSVTPTPSATASVTGLGPVCDLSSLEGDFASRHATSLAVAFAPMPAEGDCSSANLEHMELQVRSEGGDVLSVRQLDCDRFGCRMFAAPDVDGDGRAEIAVVRERGASTDLFGLYRVERCPAHALCASGPLVLAPIHVAATVDTATRKRLRRFGFGWGPALFEWYGSVRNPAGVACIPATTGHDASGPALEVWVGQGSLDGTRMHVYEVTFGMVGSSLVNPGIGDYFVPDDEPHVPPGGGSDFCGAPVTP